MTLFTSWNWFLAIKGRSVIEYMGKRETNSFLKDEINMEITNWRENLFVLFGTTSVLKMLVPWTRETPFNGLEWTFIRYDESGDVEKLI